MQLGDLFFTSSSGIGEMLEDMHWLQWAQRWKMTKLYQISLLKI